jgi:hypothetical protein
MQAMESNMTNELPRIETVSVAQPATLRLRWRGKRAGDSVDLTGWIATGGETLAPLREAPVFAKASVGNYGAAVVWDDGDLAIDATHLKMLADEQKAFDAKQARKWQEELGLSNNEAADLLYVSLSAWNSYKAGTAPIPVALAMLCRAMLRDPIMMQAHLRPRKTGRPRKLAAS